MRRKNETLNTINFCDYDFADGLLATAVVYHDQFGIADEHCRPRADSGCAANGCAASTHCCAT
jgi:hypothetical protein